VWYFRTVPSVWYFRTVPTVWYFRTVPTVWYFRTVPTVWYFYVFHFILLIMVSVNTSSTRYAYMDACSSIFIEFLHSWHTTAFSNVNQSYAILSN
jgi:hypothetical protein